jgi:hypothetical protein
MVRLRKAELPAKYQCFSRNNNHFSGSDKQPSRMNTFLYTTLSSAIVPSQVVPAYNREPHVHHSSQAPYYSSDALLFRKSTHPPPSSSNHSNEKLIPHQPTTHPPSRTQSNPPNRHARRNPLQIPCPRPLSQVPLVTSPTRRPPHANLDSSPLLAIQNQIPTNSHQSLQTNFTLVDPPEITVCRDIFFVHEIIVVVAEDYGHAVGTPLGIFDDDESEWEEMGLCFFFGLRVDSGIIAIAGRRID